MAGSIAFDRIAGSYDESRGGEGRGAGLAATMLDHVRPGPVLEVGVGTGIVALALARAGHPVAGVDLAVPMLRQARDRLGPCVAQADGYRLPVPDAAVPNAAIVWVLQLVPDIIAFLAELARVVEPGGRVVVVPSLGHWDDEISDIVLAATHALRPRVDRPHLVIDAARRAGLRHVTTVATAPQRDDGSPAEVAGMIEDRQWSVFWDLPAERWAAIVEPALTALRAMPDPHRPRARTNHHDVVVFER